MRKPDINTASDTLQTLHQYLVAQLKAEPETKELVPPIEAAMKGLVTADQQYLAATGLVTAAMATRDRADFEADDVARRAGSECKLTEGGKPGPKTKLYFPRGLAGITQAPINDQPSEMLVLAGKLAQDSDSRISAFAEPVQQKAEELAARNTEHAEAVQQAQVAFGRVLNARTEWIRQYEKTYGALVEKLGKRKAEIFFKKTARRRPRRASGGPTGPSPA